jgi:chromosome segregation protein
VRSALSEAQQQLSVLAERLLSNERAVERLDREQVESQSQQSTTAEELDLVRERIRVGAKEHEEASAALTAFREAVQVAQTQVQEHRDAVAQQREALTAARQLLNERRNQLDRYRIQADGQQRRLTENASQQSQLADRLRQVEEQIERERADLPQMDEQLARAEQTLHAAEERQRALTTEQEGLQREAEELRSQLGHSTASLEFLQGLVDTAESSKFLLTTPEWTPKGEKLTLAEVINTDERLRIAIEAALGDAARYFVVADRSEAQQAISALSKNAVGKATFLCRDAIPALDAPPSLNTGSGIIGWASELVQSDEQLRGAVRGILGHTVVVETIDDAWSAVSSTNATSAVTLSGEIVHRAGAVRGGSTSRTEGVRVGRRERIDQLRTEIAELVAPISMLASARSVQSCRRLIFADSAMMCARLHSFVTNVCSASMRFAPDSTTCKHNSRQRLMKQLRYRVSSKDCKQKHPLQRLR